MKKKGRNDTAIRKKLRSSDKSSRNRLKSRGVPSSNYKSSKSRKRTMKRKERPNESRMRRDSESRKRREKEWKLSVLSQNFVRSQQSKRDFKRMLNLTDR